jgi:2-(1,2-epoxy-1,2-dihydrophenyl)acetyl-CoA isomerase
MSAGARVRFGVGDDGVAVVTLCDPRGVNAIDSEVAAELAGALRAVASDPAAKVIVVQAEGKAFCVGGDMAQFAAAEDLHDEVLRAGEAINTLAGVMSETPKITVAVAHGAVAGGGVGLLLSADVVVAARSTVVTLGYELLATNPDAGASWFLSRDIGYRRALAMYLTSERIGAQRALELGMVTHVVDDDQAHAFARELAAKVAAGSFAAHAAAKRLFRQAASTPLARQLEDEIAMFADNTRRPEFAAAVSAFPTPQ